MSKLNLTRDRPVSAIAALVTVAVVILSSVTADGQPPRSGQPKANPAAVADPLPAGAVARIGTGRFRVGEPYPAALSSDGRRLLVGRIVLDTATGLEVGHIPDRVPGEQGGDVERVYAAPDGSAAILLTARWDGQTLTRSIARWEVTTGTVTRYISLDWSRLSDAFDKRQPAMVRGHIIAVAPQGRALIVEDNARSIGLWTNLDTGPPTPVLLGPTTGGGQIDYARFTPDGRSVIAVEATVRVWDAGTGKLRHEFRGPSGVTFRWAVSPDGKWLAAISGTLRQEGEDRPDTYRVSLWDLTTGTEARQLTDRLTCRVISSGVFIRFAPDSQTVVVLDDDRPVWTFPVRRWRVADGQALPVWPLPRPWHFGTSTPLIAPDGQTLYHVTGHGVRTFDLATGAERSPDDLRGGGYQPIGLTADDRQLITLQGQDRVRTWDLGTGRAIRDEVVPRAVIENPFHIHFSPNAQFIAVDRVVAPNDDRDMFIYDRASGRELYHLRRERCGTFSPDESRLFTLSADTETAHVRDAQTGRLLRSVRCSGDDSIFFSTDGRAFGRPWRSSTQIHNADTGQTQFNGQGFLAEYLVPERFRRLPGQDPAPYDVVEGYALGPGGKRLAVTAVRIWEGLDRPLQDRVVVFDTAPPKKLWEASPYGGRWNMNAAEFSPDGSRLAVSGERTLLLFDAATGKQIRSFDGYRGGRVGYLRFTRDGKRLLSASGDGTVWVWDVAGR